MHPILVTLTLLVAASTAHAASQSLPLECERQWIIDSRKFSTANAKDDKTLARQWLTRQRQCGATSVYWGRLAILQARSGDFAAATESLNRAPAGDPRYDYAVALARVELIVQRRLAKPSPITRSDLEEFEQRYSNLSRTYPSWPTTYALLGGIQTSLGKHSEAIVALRKAAEGHAYQLSGVFRNQTVSLSALGRHEEALAAADRAGEMDRSLLEDPVFAIAVANSHTALGYLDDARDTLQVILATRPEGKTDPAFALALEYYERRRSGR